mmetsp:Transcript_17960/g.61221  ORF Transcript_17960/g.61221 Transcript_17960/m.61221 type:complete len:424 (+) Transcript_17960:101-1372(+)
MANIAPTAVERRAHAENAVKLVQPEGNFCEHIGTGLKLPTDSCVVWCVGDSVMAQPQGYLDPVKEYFEAKFKEVTFERLSIPSASILCMEHIVAAKLVSKRPDIVLFGLSVCDYGELRDSGHNLNVLFSAYDRALWAIRSQSPECAIIFISNFLIVNSVADFQRYSSLTNAYSEFCKHHQIPFLNYTKAFCKCDLSFCFKDHCHTTAEGGRLLGNLVCKSLSSLQNECSFSDTPHIPYNVCEDSLKKQKYEKLSVIDLIDNCAHVYNKNEGFLRWAETNPGHPTLITPHFDNYKGWVLLRSGEELLFHFTGSSIVMCCLVGPTSGSLTIVIDEEERVVDLLDQWSHFFRYRLVCLATGLTQRGHKVQIKVLTEKECPDHMRERRQVLLKERQCWASPKDIYGSYLCSPEHMPIDLRVEGFFTG